MNPQDDAHDRDETIARLRRALQEEAAMVQPSDDGLHQIQQRTQAGRRPRWVPWAAVAAGVVVVAGVGVVVGMNLGPDDSGQTVAAPSASTSTTGSAARTDTTTPAPTGTTSPTLTNTSAPTAQTVAVPVYWLGEQGDDVRLYREFHPVPAAQLPDDTAVVSEAVQLALSGSPADPDYLTPWAPGSSAEVTLTPTQIVIDLNQAATDGSQMGSATAAMAVEQLVWTATAAAGSDVPVQLTVEGDTPDLFGTVSLAEPFRRTSPSYEVLAAIWVTDPQQGDRVSAPVTVRGQATVFEGALSWELRSGDQLADSGTATASEGGPGRGEWQVELGDLQPGTYTFRAFAESPAGDGQLQGEDTKTFTVE